MNVQTIALSPADIDRLGRVIANRLASQPLLVDAVELAPLINVSVETVKRYTKSGLIPCVRIGRRVLYQPEAVIWALIEATANGNGGDDE
ncbi:helix-turn-helix domain-containing protein [Novipirellula sp.]|uniref:helix-turn-helix domain-containing protein n=1 Tax=Novipirellula sp. TaxID=2795430 RepID=UPI0035633354